MKQNLFLVALLAVLSLSATAAPRTETVSSPNGEIRLVVTVGDQLQYSVYYGDELVLNDNVLSLQVGNERFGDKPQFKGVKRSRIDEVIRPVVPMKYAAVPNKANQMSLTFKGGIGVDFRAYDNGIAYRFTINKKVRRLALKSAFSAKAADDEILVLDSFGLEEIKTKEIAKILAALPTGKKTLIVLPEKDDVIYKSARNIAGVKVALINTLNVYDILNCDKLLVLQDAVSKIEEVYA